MVLLDGKRNCGCSPTHNGIGQIMNATDRVRNIVNNQVWNETID